MSFSPSASTRCRMDYTTIKRKIEAKGRRGRVGEFQLGPSVWARIDGDKIQVKLHRTDIITYYPDGTQTIQASGWATSYMTRHWWAEAGLRVWMYSIGKWTPKILGLRQYDGWTPFYDGMRLTSSGQLLSEPKPIMQRVPNAEAKALRARMSAIYREKYLPDLRFLDLDDEWPEKVAAWPQAAGAIDRYNAVELFEKDDPIRIIAIVLGNGSRGYKVLASSTFRRWVSSVCDDEIFRRRLFDEVPFNQGE